MGRVRSGRVTVFLCVCGHGGRGARLATVSLACWTSLPHRPIHAHHQLGTGRCARGLFTVTLRPLWWFWQCVVVLVASWLVCSAFVPCRRSGRSRSRICCVQVFRLLRCWSVPGVWGWHGTFVLCAARPPRGRKAMTSGWTAVKKLFFPCRCPVPSPALAVLHAQSIIRYFVVLRSRTSSFACATHMYTPRWWQGPAGTPRCVPVLPMGAPGCCSS